MVKLIDLEPNTAFRLPWRPEGKQFGLLLSISPSSARVRVPDHITGEVTDTHFSAGTVVEVAEMSDFRTQRRVDPNQPARERSEIEAPVKVVHRLCRENPGLDRDGIVKLAVALGVNISTAKTQYYAFQKLGQPVKDSKKRVRR